MILDVAILIFIVLELSNVIIMYFKPDFKYGNSMSVFNEWSLSKNEEKRYLFNKYMINWVANCKLIFILLLFVIMILGSVELKEISVAATVLSIGIYFITLSPIIKVLDHLNMIKHKGYSRKLNIMISGFMIMFVVALILHFIFEK